MSGDFAAHQELLVALLEDRLDGGGVLPGSHQVARGAAAEQQADGFDQDRFAGAGLAGEDVQAGLELDVDGVDDGQIADTEEAQHA